MNNLAAQGRCEKLYGAIIDNGGTAADYVMSEKLNWEISSVRSTASQLANNGKLHVERALNTWVLFTDEIPTKAPFDETNIEELAENMANAIKAYVEAIISNRIKA